MDSYRCSLCGYIYNPALGDTGHGVEPGTAFEDLPDTWKCPRCGAAKSRFVKV
jgi:rubredoxin